MVTSPSRTAATPAVGPPENGEPSGPAVSPPVPARLTNIVPSAPQVIPRGLTRPVAAVVPAGVATGVALCAHTAGGATPRLRVSTSASVREDTRDSRHGEFSFLRCCEIDSCPKSLPRNVNTLTCQWEHHNLAPWTAIQVQSPGWLAVAKWPGLPVPPGPVQQMNQTHALRYRHGAIAQTPTLAAAAFGGNVRRGSAPPCPGSAGVRRRLRQRPPAPSSHHPRVQRLPDRRGGDGDPPRFCRPDPDRRSRRLPARASVAAPARLSADDRHRDWLRLRP